MENKIVFDASAVLALLNREKGFEIVEHHLNDAVISSVNFSEVLTVANRSIFETDMEKTEGLKLLKNIFSHIIDFDTEQAIIAASLDKITKKHGLSLGDRACLALAKSKRLPVLTADKIWETIETEIQVNLIR